VQAPGAAPLTGLSYRHPKKGHALRRITHPARQQGAVLITVALALLFLLGFMGIALDFGRLFIAKNELQTAMDSCALAAAQELDGQSTALTRAARAGQTAGNLNAVDLQSATWQGRGQLVGADISFKNAAYALTTAPAEARYAECRHTQSGIRMWLLQAMGAVTGDAAANPATRSVSAFAVATRASAQSTCPLPLAIKPKSGGTAPHYGFTVGEWVKLLEKDAKGGEIGWANLDGSKSASETVAEMRGDCGTKVGDTLGTPGVQTTVVDEWNYRFGIYKNKADMSVGYQRPDQTGYAYTEKNWPGKSNAYNGATPTGADATAANFVTKRLSFASCADTGTALNGKTGSCESITGLKLNSFKTLAAPGAAALGGHHEYGQRDRRIVIVPVVNSSSRVIDFACMLMLHPLSIPMEDAQLEYLGNAGALNSPCVSSGLPGGVAGPLVPALAR
jgi:Flp pilus assembly protein TadG